jgi:hypothetical protein
LRDLNDSSAITPLKHSKVQHDDLTCSIDALL